MERLIYVMISAKIRKSIVGGWLKTSPEWKAVLVSRKEAQRYIAEQAVAVLSEEEKRYIEVFGIDRTRLQSQIHYSNVTQVAAVGGLRTKNVWMGYSFGSTMYQGREYLDSAMLRVEGDPIYVNPGKVPMLFALDRDALVKFKEDQPEVYLGVAERLIKWYDAMAEFNNKLKGLGMVITRDEMTLTLLKKYVKGLYDGREKEIETEV